MRQVSLIGIAVLIVMSGASMHGQDIETVESIGGIEHESRIYGVQIGMDVSSALESVFVNAERKLGEEKPDALRKEGKGKQDIRVVYKSLPKGELQILFAGGTRVSQIVLIYRQAPTLDDLRLPFSGSVGGTSSTIYNTSASQPGTESPGLIDGTKSIEEFGSLGTRNIDKYSAKKIGNVDRRRSDLLDGARYDDRYSVGFTDNLGLQRIWWRDEKVPEGFRIRLTFLGKKQTEAGAKFVPSIVQKTVSVSPDDEEKFASLTRIP